MFDLRPACFQEARKLSDGDTVDAGRPCCATPHATPLLCCWDRRLPPSDWRLAPDFRVRTSPSPHRLLARWTRPMGGCDRHAHGLPRHQLSLADLPRGFGRTDILSPGRILLYPVTVTGYRAPWPDADLTSASACTLREKRKAQATESAWAAKSLAELRAIK
jgi:hypothetical protein